MDPRSDRRSGETGGDRAAESMRFPYADIVLLGVVTLAAYGTWAYSFGVLLDPLLDDTGWSESVVTGAFAVSSALGGLIALPAGRLLDAVGARRVFLLAAAVSTVFLVSASYATGSLVFVGTAVAGGAALAGLAFYHVTQTVAVRAAPREGTRAIALLTIVGAFSSAIYLPLAAVLVDAFGWRVALRSMAVGAGVVLVVAAVFVRERVEPGAAPRRSAAPISLRRPEVVRFLVATALAGIAIGIVLVYQVPLMVGAGLPLATAATVAGVRGALQIVGRLPMTSMLARWDVRTVTRLAFASVAVGLILLGFAGNLWVAALVALVAGFGIGAGSPLQGIYADELVDRSPRGGDGHRQHGVGSGGRRRTGRRRCARRPDRDADVGRGDRRRIRHGVGGHPPPPTTEPTAERVISLRTRCDNCSRLVRAAGSVVVVGSASVTGR
ncbi:MAG: MFS transporter [Ilumatobacteraceae bacterium]